jgi:hypothetical protein
MYAESHTVQRHSGPIGSYAVEVGGLAARRGERQRDKGLVYPPHEEAAVSRQEGSPSISVVAYRKRA